MKKTLHAGKYLALVADGTWEYVERVNASAVVAIVALTPEGELLLVEQHRRPVGAVVIELPAGLVGDEDAGEELTTAAARELEEETGYRPARCAVLCRAPSSAGMTTELVTIVKAEGLEQVSAGGGVAGEAITVRRVPLAEAPAWLEAQAQAGSLIDAKVFAALYWLRV